MTGRPRSFDESEVLEKAMALFWSQGYEATALSELTEAMGIGRQSLYDTFGDKHSLFTRALTHYLETTLNEAAQTLEAIETPSGKIREWLSHAVLGLCIGGAEPRGCFALNTVVERCPGDESIAGVMKSHHGKMMTLLCGILSAGQETGEFRRDYAPKDLTTMVLSCSAGLVVTSKLQPPPEVGEKAVEMLLAFLKG